MVRVLLLLLPALAGLAGEPLHAWAHAAHVDAPLPVSGEEEVHDGDCEHGGDDEHIHMCALCSRVHAELDATQEVAVVRGSVSDQAQVLPESAPRRPTDPRRLGARAPPRVG